MQPVRLHRRTIYPHSRVSSCTGAYRPLCCSHDNACSTVSLYYKYLYPMDDCRRRLPSVETYRAWRCRQSVGSMLFGAQTNGLEQPSSSQCSTAPPARRAHCSTPCRLERAWSSSPAGSACSPAVRDVVLRVLASNLLLAQPPDRRLFAVVEQTPHSTLKPARDAVAALRSDGGGGQPAHLRRRAARGGRDDDQLQPALHTGPVRHVGRLRLAGGCGRGRARGGRRL